METLDYVKNTIIIIVLAFALLFVLTMTHIVPCSSVSFAWCDAYWSIMGPPKVMIAFTGEGLGNAVKLQELLANHDVVGVKTQLQNIEYLKATTQLKPYDMIIVTQAKTLTADQMNIFYDYANLGNILVWTGDAGTSIPPGEKRPIDYNYQETSVWVRVNSEGILVPLNTLISAEYIDNYCNIVNCSTQNKDFVGNFVVDSYSDLTAGINPKQVQLYGNTAIVQLINNTSTKMDLAFDFSSNMMSKSNTKIPVGQKVFPIFIRTGIGGNVFYSATPLENLLDIQKQEYEAINTGMQLPTTIRNIYKFYFGKFWG